MDRIKNIFDRIGSIIPGYKGYAEREGRRNFDKNLRDSLSIVLSECERVIYLKMKEAINSQDKSKLNELENLRKETNTFLSKIKFAPYGVTSYFSDNQIKEDELFLILQHDLNLAENINLYSEFLGKESLIDCLNQLKKCSEILSKRNSYINEFK